MISRRDLMRGGGASMAASAMPVPALVAPALPKYIAVNDYIAWNDPLDVVVRVEDTVQRWLASK